MEDGSLNFVDYIVIAVILLSTVFAFIRGFIKSFLSLFGWGASIYLTYICFPFIKPLMEEKIKNPLVIIAMGHTLLLIGFLILFGIINLLSTTAVKGLTSGMIDRSLGAIFGIIRGIVILSFIFFIIHAGFFVFSGAEDVESKDQKDQDILPKSIIEAKSYPILKQGRIMLMEIIPDSFYENFHKMYDEVSKRTVNERFIEAITKKLETNLSPQQIKNINAEIDELSLTESEAELERSKLGKMFNAYKKVGSSHHLKNPIRDDEARRIDEILKSSQEPKSSQSDNFEDEVISKTKNDDIKENID